MALAALLRERMNVPELVPHEIIPSLTINEVGDAITALLAENSEHGKRAQAVAAAILQLVYQDVQTSRINDPSRRLPGDCHVMIDGNRLIMAVEVKDKPVSEGETVEFARRLRAVGVGRGMYLAVSSNQKPLEVGQETGKALHEYHVLLEIMTDIRKLMHDAVV